VVSERGLDQGCPLSPGLFSAALAPCLADLLDQLRCLDPNAEVYAYLDDVFVVIEAEHTTAAASLAAVALGRVGLSLEPSKTKVWTPEADVILPAAAAEWRRTELTCLGNTLPFVKASQDLSQEADGATRVPLGSVADPSPVKAALDGLSEKLAGLQAKGLRKQSVWVLFRTYVNGASNHVLRACLASSDWCEQYDAAVVSFVERLVEAPLDGTQRAQLWLPLKHGGLGLGSACLRRSAAYLASWEQCFGEVAQARGAASAQALLAEVPKAAAAMEAAGADLRGLGVWRYHADWAGCLESGKPRRQKLYGSVVQGAARKRLLAQLGGDDRIDFRSAGGGGGAFLLPPSEQTHLMPDDHFTVATRLRLRVPHPGHLGRQPPGQAQQCGHQYVQSRRQCTGLLDSRGLHGLVCNVGGGR
jgi:hypothetical protein